MAGAGYFFIFIKGKQLRAERKQDKHNMGIGLRVFFVNDDDSVQLLSTARYNRLFREDSGECLPQYAGKRVRCALVVLDVVGRKPLTIRAIDCSIVSFDANGCIDSEDFQKQMRLGMESMLPILEKRPSDNVIDAGHQFAKKRYHQEFKWKPSPRIKEAIFRAIFG